jgi:hypothetical protein
VLVLYVLDIGAPKAPGGRYLGRVVVVVRHA